MDFMFDAVDHYNTIKKSQSNDNKTHKHAGYTYRAIIQYSIAIPGIENEALPSS